MFRGYSLKTIHVTCTQNEIENLLRRESNPRHLRVAATIPTRRN